LPGRCWASRACRMAPADDGRAPQYLVLVAVGISVILYVVRQSEQLTLVRLETNDEGRTREAELPTAGEIIVVQPHGSLFVASAPALERQRPAVTPNSSNAVVIIRLRGMDDLGVRSIEVIRRYTRTRWAVGSKLVIVVDHDRVHHQLSASGLVDELGTENVYEGTEWLGEATGRAHSDAEAWIRSRSS